MGDAGIDICPYLSLSLVDGGWAMGDGSDSTTSTCVIDGPNGPRDRNVRDTASTPMCFMILMHSPSEHVPKGFLMISIYRDMANQSSGRTDRQLRNRWTLGVPTLVWYKKPRRIWREPKIS